MLLEWIEERTTPRPKPDQAWFEKVFCCIAGFDTEDEIIDMKNKCEIPTVELKQEYKHALKLLARQIAQNVQIHFKALPKRVV